MASVKESPTKKKISWTPELTQKMFIAIINTIEPSQLDYAKVAEQLGEVHSYHSVYKRIYDLKKKYANEGYSSTVTSAKSTPKKRKISRESE